MVSTPQWGQNMPLNIPSSFRQTWAYSFSLVAMGELPETTNARRKWHDWQSKKSGMTNHSTLCHFQVSYNWYVVGPAYHQWNESVWENNLSWSLNQSFAVHITSSLISLCVLLRILPAERITRCLSKANHLYKGWLFGMIPSRYVARHLGRLSLLPSVGR